MEKKYICIQDEKGKPSYREATPEELAAMQPQAIEWHYPECPIRIIFSDKTKENWLNKYKENEILGTYPEVAGLLEYVKQMSTKKVTLNGETHIYLEEIYPEHRAIIEANGAIIEPKPI